MYMNVVKYRFRVVFYFLIHNTYNERCEPCFLSSRKDVSQALYVQTKVLSPALYVQTKVLSPALYVQRKG